MAFHGNQISQGMYSEQHLGDSPSSNGPTWLMRPQNPHPYADGSFLHLQTSEDEVVPASSVAVLPRGAVGDQSHEGVGEDASWQNARYKAGVLSHPPPFHFQSSHPTYSCSSSNSTTTSQTCSRLIDRRQLDCRKAKGDRSMIYDVVDTGLVLGRTYGGTNCSSSPAPSGSKLTKSRNDKKLRDSSSNHSDADEPSLTLGLVAESNRRSGSAAVDRDQKSMHPSSPQSAASSLSNNFPMPNIKRETEVAGNDLQEGSAKKKLRLTKEQSTLLEGSFKEHSTLSPKQKLALAKELDLRPRQVEVWFQNRRARTKLKQTEIDFEFLKRYSESLKEENGRLQKEISQLRTMKLTPGGGGCR